MSEQVIAITKIRAPEWNSRLNGRGDIDGLAASMLSEGQMNAVNVEGPDDTGMYDLVAGSRRVRAAVSIGWKEIRATVDPPTEISQRIVKNVVENLQRKDLSLYEQARACSKLRDEKLSLKDIAEKTGLSVAYVSNLAGMYKGLPTIVLKAWEENHEAATFNFLRDLLTVAKEAPSPEEGAEAVLAKWQARTELYIDFQRALVADEAAEIEEAQEKEPKEKKETTDFKVKGPFFETVMEDVRASKMPGAQFAITVMKLLRGDIEEIKGVYPSTDTQNAGKNVKPEDSKPKKKTKKGKE